MTLVDKRRLAEAVKPNCKTILVFNFAWSHYLDENVLQSLCISGVGDIAVPISSMVFNI